MSRRFLRKTGGANCFWAVRPLSLTLEAGTVTVLMGRSGSGKTTLLHMLSGLLRPTEGRVLLDGADLYALDDKALSRLRNERLAVIPQGRSCVDTLTVMENLLLPGELYGHPPDTSLAEEWLERLGIAALRDVRTAELSGGELRRVAITRALLRDAPVLLADEPTGDLDDANTALALSLLRQAAHEAGKAVLLVTHEAEARDIADRTLRMEASSLLAGDNEA